MSVDHGKGHAGDKKSDVLWGLGLVTEWLQQDSDEEKAGGREGKRKRKGGRGREERKEESGGERT